MTERSIAPVGIAAATERTVCSGVSNAPTSPSRISKSCGFAMRTRTFAKRQASALSSVAATP